MGQVSTRSAPLWGRWSESARYSSSNPIINSLLSSNSGLACNDLTCNTHEWMTVYGTALCEMCLFHYPSFDYDANLSNPVWMTSIWDWNAWKLLQSRLLLKTARKKQGDNVIKSIAGFYFPPHSGDSNIFPLQTSSIEVLKRLSRHEALPICSIEFVWKDLLSRNQHCMSRFQDLSIDNLSITSYKHNIYRLVQHSKKKKKKTLWVVFQT